MAYLVVFIDYLDEVTLDTYLISDATATFDKVGFNGKHYSSELIHSTALASLHGEFSTVITSENLFNML